jgi:hypothetical protein
MMPCSRAPFSKSEHFVVYGAQPMLSVETVAAGLQGATETPASFDNKLSAISLSPVPPHAGSQAAHNATNVDPAAVGTLKKRLLTRDITVESPLRMRFKLRREVYVEAVALAT